ncbi:MAG: NAD-dependent epimerase/dehydratase family protein [Ktedonobacterales bacterium]|nr:NAD-dependent epimerase/dehydratase family protein [Ktedonobacterales bacterium]
MEILVTGGTGFLGQHLALALLRAGHGVRLMGRDFEGARAVMAAGAVPVAADLCAEADVLAACAGVDAVYHVGALSAPWGRRAEFFTVNVAGTEAVLAGCRRFGVRRLIYVSSPSVVFDGHDHRDLTEAAPYPTRFASVYSLTKKLGEDRVNAVGAEGLETVILRPKAIFGPGDRALLPRLIEAARRGRLPQIGDGRNLVDLTYVENVVHALLLALESRAAVGGTYTITNAEHVPLWQAIRAVLARLGLSERLRVVPARAALAAASLMEARAVVTGREPLLTRYSAAILARTQTYDISAARRDLAYAPPISFSAGMERTLAALERARGDTASVRG